jgi:4-amino-4-deoxy-L-arabinose transferase-like glycosyltransferase
MSTSTVRPQTEPVRFSLLQLLQTRFFWPAAAILLGVMCLEMYLSARTESETFDEPAHLYAGYSYWARGYFGVNPEHPPLVKLVASAPAALFDKPAFNEPAPFYFRAVSGLGGFQMLLPPSAAGYLAHGRLAASVFPILLALLVTLAAIELFDRATALFALTLLVFDPLVLGHGPLITTDMGATCTMFAAVYCFYRFIKRPGAARLALCGAATGLALAAKHSMLFLLPILVLLAVYELVANRRTEQKDATAKGWLRRAALLLGAGVIIGGIAVTILWGFYGFRYAAFPDNHSLIPPPAAFLQDVKQPMERTGIAFAMKHHLLPEAYLFGLMDVVQLCRDGRIMYLLGKIYGSGRWFYFPAAMLIKCTLGLLGLIVFALFSPVLRSRQHRREIVFMAVPALAFFGWAMTSRLDIGIRHVLPVFPFLLVLVAAGAVNLARRSRPRTWAAGILLFAHAASSLHAAPNYLPYSNEAFGGPSRTWRALADSNVGWAGGLKALKANLEERNIKDCWFGYEALPNPQSRGIVCKPLPTLFGSYVDSGQHPPVPAAIHGPVFFSSEEQAGGLWGPAYMSPYRQFMGRMPDRVIAGEILEYDGDFTVPELSSMSHAFLTYSFFDPKKILQPQSLEYARKAVELDPSSLMAHETLSEVLAAQGHKEEAVREYHMAKEIFSRVPAEFKISVDEPQDPTAQPRH